MLSALSIAPMLDWTDRHCRYFHRLITRQALLYTEMVTTGALLYGDVARHLDYSSHEHPVALQLGGSEPVDLACCARLALEWGYDEINLNCGCPSPRVQRGAFGACLMAEPSRVRDSVAAMVEAVSGTIPVTVKHRIGVDHEDSYGFVRDFVGTVSQGGCETFIVHARSAWLDGLSPKENRDIPPLRPEFILQLRRDFPALAFVLNGGIKTGQQIGEWLPQVSGVMVGRAAYQDPWSLATWDREFLGSADSAAPEREIVEEQMGAYIAAWKAKGLHPQAITRHMLNLWKGQPGGRRWRQVLSDSSLLSTLSVPELFATARRARLSAEGDEAMECNQPSQLGQLGQPLTASACV
ncbi:tRNA dihydrouridine(20/20a) synthase DusA [Thiomonas arsenitoxydans]|uniref:tRNA-dihydrouridine(20/20a) synthase n=2 Tax=Thiomonas arsenitoxydans (strain DSM 22701 / CIP 110005 / 3As) TaxID=426114 RepID=D6CUY6_THIA3|nr:tRNA dihydrouridine(20/20a) synthase DusA [Thiomonas arsenitoxydans]CAZ89105.1 tRNA-dihydrouridine synthase A [Thiomonas arsenitoxydans]